MDLKRSRILVIVLSLLVAACAGDGAADDDEAPTVVATTSILGDVTQNIVGDHAEVDVLMPPGSDPHDYSASARDVEAISSADLVIANGLALEESLENILQSAESDGVTVLRVGELVDPIPFDSDSTTDPSEDQHTTDDPHFWLDPLRMRTAAEAISRALADVAPDIDWQSAASAYEAELTALDAEVVEILAPIPPDQRILVTNHDALEYFADRYGFRIAGVVIPGGSTLAEPSAADLADLVETLKELDVRAIFVENTASPVLADTVAGELGGEVTIATLYTGSLGEADGPASTYIGMIRENAKTITSALAPES